MFATRHEIRVGVVAGATGRKQHHVARFGNLRCLRVGSVHDEDYGAVKSLLAGR